MTLLIVGTGLALLGGISMVASKTFWGLPAAVIGLFLVYVAVTS